MTTHSTVANYIGRFAPSPTGPLHMGSLVAALASFLDAKQHRGQWHVRIEDLDPPREQRGAASSIINSLECHHLFWDGPIFYQSRRHCYYEQALTKLHANLYACRCTRQRLQTLNGIYDGHCRHHCEITMTAPATTPAATRINTTCLPLPLQALAESYRDIFYGQQHQPLADTGDFIVRRKDQLFAYQLAVVVDDIAQGITHIIRGADLLDSTARQRYLYLLLDGPLPQIGHVPLVMNAQGQKLSKQNHAQPLDNHHASHNLCQALAFLKHPVPETIAATQHCESILQWAIAHWDRKAIAQERLTA